MAKDVDAGEVVVSSIRAGMKREFSMMMKAQSEMGGELSVGRRRVTRSQNSGGSSKENVGNGGKRMKREDGEKAERGLVDVGIDLGGPGGDLRSLESAQVGEGMNEGGFVVHENEGTVQTLSTESVAGPALSGGTGTSTSNLSKLKKVELLKVPTKLRDLLETGLLEGLAVCYIRGSKAREQPGSENLRGFIRGTGILCSCEECKGEKVVTPNQFELHAGSGNKRPPEYIYLENGKNLRDVLNACKREHSDSLDVVIRNFIGRADLRPPASCLKCKGSIGDTSGTNSVLRCGACVVPKESGGAHVVPKESGLCPAQTSEATYRDSLSSVSSPVASCSQSEVSNKSQFQSKTQKLTRKDLGMHKVVFADNVLEDGTNLSYIVQGEVSPSQFEAHAGFASRRKPYDNIYTPDGASLHEIALGLSTLRKSSSKGNDDLCSTCKEGGELLCCDNCPRAFHLVCVRRGSIPQEKWYCKYCENMFQRANVAKLNANAIAAGRVAGFDPLEEIRQRCIRILGILEADVGGCALCRGHDFSAVEFNDSTVIICDQCEKEYHVGCLREHKIDDMKELPDNEWFCCTECLATNSILQKLISDGEQILPQPVLDIVKKKCEEKGVENASNLDIKWRVLSGKTASGDTRAWLSGAVNIFHDRFDPIADSSTSRRDLIPDLVYGRQFKDQDLGGMYCAILIVNSEVVSAATFRVFGQEVAELPLVATSIDSQGKGYFQSLFFCIETLLKSLDVKDLVLPAAEEVESLWRERFGFQKLSQEQLDQYTESYQLLIFQGTSVLHKPISQPSES
ncbi:hypothetical protein F511_40713 [Dorcoceras hygrometricum]|uniref:PHD-type domain-containing protein n=1 Tax=Dorcoceras hygrometricum TaxID=472368 RepID=A0A2Z7B8C4_9LAMI|nr:hypothetical protein F511_40713 [Dorcoceras hygrometricum]